MLHCVLLQGGRPITWVVAVRVFLVCGVTAQRRYMITSSLCGSPHRDPDAPKRLHQVTSPEGSDVSAGRWVFKAHCSQQVTPCLAKTRWVPTSFALASVATHVFVATTDQVSRNSLSQRTQSGTQRVCACCTCTPSLHRHTHAVTTLPQPQQASLRMPGDLPHRGCRPYASLPVKRIVPGHSVAASE